MLFYAFWRVYSPHPWEAWSILGSGLIIFNTNFSVQVSVALNDWRGFFYDMVQQALTTPGSVAGGQFYLGIWQFLSLALVGITVAVLNLFFVRHYIFRWRTAMNDYFIALLAAAAPHRGRLAACAGRHDAIFQHDAEPRRQFHRFRR